MSEWWGEGWILDALALTGAVGVGIAAGFLLFVHRPESSRRLTTLHESDPNRLLIDGLIGTYDMVRSAAVRSYIETVLSRVGIERLDIAPCEPFDSTVHEAVGRETTEEGSLLGCIADTVRTGWREGNQPIRIPQVRVFTRDNAHGRRQE